MRQHSLLKLVISIVVIIGAFFFLVQPLASSIRQGLDLQGGTHVVLEAVDTAQAQVNDDAMNRVVAIMEKRVNSLGLTEPIIQREGERRVIIELPGIKDPDAAIRTIGKTAMLEFRDEEGNTVLTGTDLKDAQASTNPQTGQNVVNLEFSDEGAQKFADLTMKNVGRTIAILLDGEVLTAPNVREPILGGRALLPRDGYNPRICDHARGRNDPLDVYGDHADAVPAEAHDQLEAVREPLTLRRERLYARCQKERR